MKRRQFVAAAIPSFTVGAPTIMASHTSGAFVPLLLRLFVGGVLRGTVSRTVTTTITRQFVATASFGLRASGILAVSTGVAYAYRKHGASEIWVTGSAQQTVSISTEEGSPAKREQVYVGYRVVDIETGAIEKVGLKNVSVEPGKKISLRHIVKDLPNAGAKFVEGLATFDSKGNQVNQRFPFGERKTVIVAIPDEVQSA